MKDNWFKSMLVCFLVFSSHILFGQNTLPSCVITAPHNNAYFMESSDITIHVYASDLGGSFTGGNITKVELFIDDSKLGETSTESSNTYTFLWSEVAAGTYRISAKATDNEDAVFTSAGVIITVGSSEVKSLGLSGGRGKYLANIIPNDVRGDFNTYWNGVTAENSCKWGSVEGTRDLMNWSSADKAYNHARDFNMSFRYHALAWGSQYPSWIQSLTPEEFQEEMEEYMAAISERYPMIDQIDVLNESMYLNTWNGEEHAAGTPYFREGLGGPGETGYDWVIWLFEKARSYFPNSKLMINDFELVTNTSGRNEILDIIKVLRDRGLIDGFGTQSHYFNVDGISSSNLQNALNSMATSGVPVYVTELDLKGSNQNESSQLSSYQNTFPVYWEHPAVAGITLWGYVEGSTWSEGTGILNSNGSERSAMTWLKTYMLDQTDVGYPFESGGIIVDTVDNILLNGEFDNGTLSWQIDNYEGGMGNISTVSDKNMSGGNALQICITDPGSASWHVQVSQDAPFEAGKNYEISFIAKADEAVSISATMQQGGDPYTQYFDEAVNLTIENQSFSFSFNPSMSDASNKLKFFLGLNTTCIFIDRVVFKEIGANSTQVFPENTSISIFPNPIVASYLSVKNNSGRKINSIEIYDLKGSLLKTLAPYQSQVKVDVSDLSKGVYFVRIHDDIEVVSKKIIVQ